ncbi:MAG: hypothetical protein ACI4OR_01070 [Alphaproteobacteria bacterium]
MNKFLLASTISLISLGAFAEPVRVQQLPADQAYAGVQTAPAVYQKQTVVRYNVPTCKNCQTTTTVNRVMGGAEPVMAPVPCPSGNCNKPCTTCGAPVAPVVAPAPIQKPKSCVFDNHKYAIANPLFVLKKGQFSSDTVAGYFVQPKDLTYLGYNTVTGEHDYAGRYRFNQWHVAEQVMYGITDWLSVKLQAGYQANRPKKSTWYLVNNGANPDPVVHNYSYDATIGLQAHAVDTCNFDLIVGVDATWGKAGYKQGACKDSEDYKLVTPYAIMGGQITKYVTPYLQAGYTFAVDTKKELADDAYALQPGIYIQPSKYFAIHPYINKVEHQKPEWNLALDFYPYQNLVVGIEGSAVSWDKDPMGMYGISGRIKMTF